MYYELEFDGKTTKDFKIYISKRPDIQTPQLRTNAITIENSDGEFYTSDNRVEDIEIDVEMGFKDEERRFNEHFRIIKNWLLNYENNILRFNDDETIFYKVKKVIISENNRSLGVIGNFKVKFICDGYSYDVSGNELKDISELAINADEEKALFNNGVFSYPIFYIKGKGTLELAVNNKTKGKILIRQLDGTIIIDTKNKISFFKDGSNASSFIQGDYDDLILENGKNIITASPLDNDSNVEKVEIKTNWRYF